jgi:hypothetical protein
MRATSSFAANSAWLSWGVLATATANISAAA